jgi:hypothetical protein
MILALLGLLNGILVVFGAKKSTLSAVAEKIQKPAKSQQQQHLKRWRFRTASAGPP